VSAPRHSAPPMQQVDRCEPRSRPAECQAARAGRKCHLNYSQTAYSARQVPKTEGLGVDLQASSPERPASLCSCRPASTRRPTPS
jgi:hypothetical protein